MKRMNKQPLYKKMIIIVVIVCALINIASPMESYAADAVEQCTGLRKLNVQYVEASEFDSNIFNAKRKMATNTYWDKFASEYYYNRMNSAQKKLYDDLRVVCNTYLNGDSNFPGSSGKYYIDAVPYKNLSDEMAQYVTLVFAYSNPQYYFLEATEMQIATFSDGTKALRINVYTDLASGQARRNATNQMKSKIDSWLNVVNRENTKLAKEKKIHDLLVDNTEYATNTYDQSCYSTFIYGKTVCAGYAEAFELLCCGAGIECIVVTSTSHEWNQVNYNGTWYAVDATWNDTSRSNKYYNVSDIVLKKDNLQHEPENFWSIFQRPVCGNGTSSEPAIYNGVDYASVFNANYYSNHYPDLQRAYGYDKNALLQHFIEHGIYEGRQAIASFNIQSYRNRYPDLREGYRNNILGYVHHYINYGKREGRVATGYENNLVGATTKYKGIDYSLVYNYNYYVSKYPDIKKAFGFDENAVIQHFVEHGIYEGRQAIASFHIQSYRNRYPDLREGYKDNTLGYVHHYINYGKREGRVATGYENTVVNPTTRYKGTDYFLVYDYNYYVNKYPDIKKAYGYDDTAVLQHFVEHGMSECRQGKQTFNVRNYRYRYPDLDRAYGEDGKSYFMHFIMHGKSEGRSGV